MKAILEESEQITMLFTFNDTYWEYIGTITKQLKLVSYYEEKKKKRLCSSLNWWLLHTGSISTEFQFKCLSKILKFSSIFGLNFCITWLIVYVRLNLFNHVLALFRAKFACNLAIRYPVFMWELCKGNVWESVKKAQEVCTQEEPRDWISRLGSRQRWHMCEACKRAEGSHQL